MIGGQCGEGAAAAHSLAERRMSVSPALGAGTELAASVAPLLEQEPVVRVAISSLRFADSPRSTGVNLEHARMLAESDLALVPIVVDRRTMRIIDGAHRVHAAALRGETEVSARFFDGSADEAFVLAVRTNIAHGLPLSLSDRKAAAARIAAIRPQWSDRMIASVTGLAPGTVASTRGCPTGQVGQLDARLGRDGRVRSRNSTEGRRLASEIIVSNPHFSLRRIAAVAGISPETVRNVRERLRRGESPFPASQERPAREEPATAPAPIDVDTSAMETLRTDPSLRLTVAGRHLLRLLDLNRMLAEHGEQLADGVPPHSAGRVADVARQCAEAWQRFAEQVGRKTDQEIPA
jgi:hypothetical protein